MKSACRCDSPEKSAGFEVSKAVALENTWIILSMEEVSNIELFQGFRIVGYDMFFFHRWLECAMWKMEGGRIRGQSTFCWPWMGPTNKGRILWFLRYFHLIRVRFSFATFPWQLLLPFVAFRFLPNKTLVTSGLIHSAFRVCTIKKRTRELWLIP